MMEECSMLVKDFFKQNADYGGISTCPYAGHRCRDRRYRIPGYPDTRLPRCRSKFFEQVHLAFINPDFAANGFVDLARVGIP